MPDPALIILYFATLGLVEIGQPLLLLLAHVRTILHLPQFGLIGAAFYLITLYFPLQTLYIIRQFSNSVLVLASFSLIALVVIDLGNQVDPT